MNQALSPYLTVLLPTARVALHVQDDALLSSVHDLKQDWRFAQVQFETQKGDVQSAIDYYSSHPSPDLLLIETKTIDDHFTTQLETLAGVCSEHTAAIVIGPVNDVYLYRKLIDMGVNDYLVGPLRKDTAIDVIAKSLINRVGHGLSRVIAFAGAKGGAGTSTLAQYAGLISSQTLGQKTLLLDMAGAWSFMPLAMGVEPATSFVELYRLASSVDQDAFRRLIHVIDDKLSILPTGLEKLLDDSLQVEAFEMLLNHLMVTYPVIMIDISGAPSSLQRYVLDRAHQIFIVSNATLPSLRNTRSLFNEIKNLHNNTDSNVEILINLVGLVKDCEVSSKDIETALEKKPAGYIDFMPRLFMKADMMGVKTLQDPTAQNVLNIFVKLLQPIIGGAASVAPPLETHKHKFLKFLLSLKEKQ